MFGKKKSSDFGNVIRHSNIYSFICMMEYGVIVFQINAHCLELYCNNDIYCRN